MQYKCQRCNHSWKPRKKQKPRVCPSCKSAYWDTPTKKISKDFVDITKKNIVILHDLIIKESGGAHGIRDEGGVHNAAYRILKFIQKNHKFPYKVGAFIFEDLAKRHHFSDGNKRTAYCFTKVYLMLTGYHLKVEYPAAVSFILQIASHESPKTFNEIEQWIKHNIEKISPKHKIDKYLKELYYDIIHEKKEEET